MNKIVICGWKAVIAFCSEVDCGDGVETIGLAAVNVILHGVTFTKVIRIDDDIMNRNKEVRTLAGERKSVMEQRKVIRIFEEMEWLEAGRLGVGPMYLAGEFFKKIFIQRWKTFHIMS